MSSLTVRLQCTESLKKMAKEYTCTLHRNMLLPVGFLSSEVVQARKERRIPPTRLSRVQSSDSDQMASLNSSFDDYFPVPKTLDKSNHDQAQGVNSNQETNLSADSEVPNEDAGEYLLQNYLLT